MNLLAHHRPRAIGRRPSRLALVLTAIAGVSLSALAVAVVPLAPDAADLPTRTVSVEATALDPGAQLEALAAHPLVFSRGLVVRGPDNLGAVLRRAGVEGGTPAVSELASVPAIRDALALRSARSVAVRVDGVGRLVSLTLRHASQDEAQSGTHFVRVSATLGANGWAVDRQTVPLGSSLRFAGGTIRSSLFAATDEAGLDDAVAIQLAEIFSSDIDFHRQLRKNDSFALVYESLTADGEPVVWSGGTGRVLAAEFNNAGRVHQAIWFQEPGQDKGDYFDATGKSRQRAFLASPLEFSRVTSGFAIRVHPIFKDLRAHRGVDYAAPQGTAVRTVAEGEVRFAGRQGGYGNVVEIQHAGDRSTLYAHLSRIDVKPGQRVARGSMIGAVGSTGWSTGPHLHFEFRVGGVHKDPVEVARQAAQPVELAASARERFHAHATGLHSQLQVAYSVSGQAQALFE